MPNAKRRPGGGGAAECEPGGHKTQHNKNRAEALARPIFALRLEPLPGIDGRHALREALKRLLRNHGLRCVACVEEAGR